LGVIAKSRNQGIGQFQLAEKLKMDSKAVFYYLKKLDSLGLM
jgi:predicted transcriptional regulator